MIRSASRGELVERCAFLILRFLGAIAYLVVLTVVGTVGYVSIEGWPWREGLLITVGYAAFTEIVRRQLHLHAITFEHANVVLPHLT